MTLSNKCFLEMRVGANKLEELVVYLQASIKKWDIRSFSVKYVKSSVTAVKDEGWSVGYFDVVVDFVSLERLGELAKELRGL